MDAKRAGQPDSSPTQPASAGTWQARLLARDPALRVHLLGIGGAGLSAIAQVLLEMGVQVSGSDRRPSPVTARLAAAGATIFPAQSAANLAARPKAHYPDVVLISSAIDEANPERRAAEALGIPVVKRLDFLPVLLANRRVLAVAGSAGKSTTTAMLISILSDAGLAPGYIVGADLPDLGNAAAGQSDYFVIEADEYDRMFLGLNPAAAIITNVEWDHPDCYPTPASFRRAFMQFVDTVDRHGLVVSCRDDEGAEQLRAYALSRGPEWMTYGLSPEANLRASDVALVEGGGSTAEIECWEMPCGRLDLQVPGIHNIRNALAAAAAAVWCDVPMADAFASLARYRGVARRFERKGEAAGVVVYDDYAHHPIKVAATLEAARQRFPQQRIWAVFQPHTFSRTRHFLHEMAASFAAADQVIVTDIYAAREVDDGTVRAAAIVAASDHPAIRHIARLEDAADYLAAHVAAGDVVITLGAGDGYRVGEMLLEQLAAHAPEAAP
ncbi:MAG: UDP-N-acetylmuramate--L-alanine ligase [Chloroflexi bacterium]|nr:MAG: UDP-N-acetylmuramate--L-alanine ligase [Chloroflexota bacterium]